MTTNQSSQMTDTYDVGSLLSRLWVKSCLVFPELNSVSSTWAVGESDHFNSPRGFATTTTDGTYFHLKLAQKLLTQPEHRIEAIMRHEIGHIVDFSGIEVPPGLPTSPERRADAIAELIWEEFIYYDNEDVQSLLPGIRPRPIHLGL